MKPNYTNKKSGKKFAKITVPFFVGYEEIEASIGRLLNSKKKVTKKNIIEQIKATLFFNGSQIDESHDITFDEIEEAEIISKKLYPEFYN